MNEQEVREYWDSATHVEKLFFVAARGDTASFAYRRLQMHLWAARTQMGRIGVAIADPKLPEPGQGATQQQIRDYVRESERRMQAVFAEVHLYLVSWAGCRNMLELLVGQPEFLEAKKTFDRYRRDFEYYVEGRNSFEHFDDRLPGQAEARRVKEVQPDPGAGPYKVFAGLSGGKYLHSNR